MKVFFSDTQYEWLREALGPLVDITTPEVEVVPAGGGLIITIPSFSAAEWLWEFCCTHIWWHRDGTVTGDCNGVALGAANNIRSAISTTLHATPSAGADYIASVGMSPDQFGEVFQVRMRTRMQELERFQRESERARYRAVSDTYSEEEFA